MKNIFLSSIILFLMTGCYGNDNKSYHFEWATVNSRLIETELLNIAKKQHPYPVDIDVDLNQLRIDSRNLSNQISSFTKMERNKCLPKKAPSRDKTSSRTRYPNPYNNECYNKINSDPLMLEMREKKEKLNTISRLRSNHDRKVREASKKSASILIGQYSKNKFEIVINDNKRNILYNRKGLSIDITDAILNQVRESEPTIAIQ